MEKIENEKYTFEGMDITNNIKSKALFISFAVSEQTGFPFSEVYEEFTISPFYEMLKDPTTLLWMLPNEEVLNKYYEFTEKKDMHK